MEIIYQNLISGLWVAWILYWYLTGLNLKRTVRREGIWHRLLYTGLLVAGAALFTVAPSEPEFLSAQIWEQRHSTFWLGAVIMLLGIAFTVWARVTLGRNWSSTVTLKEDHELVMRGPYAWVRHPIYTGILVMFVGSEMALGQWRGAIGIVLVLVSFLFKLSIEEKWMIELFGEQYVAYRKRVAMLIPWLW